jgi:hypothetical protein
MGPELLRVKDLARRSNNFTEEDYTLALSVLGRINTRKEYGIIYRRGGAGKETVPANTRLGGEDLISMSAYISPCKPGEYDPILDIIIPEDCEPIPGLMGNLAGTYSTGDQAMMCELKESDLYKLDMIDDVSLDIKTVLAPTNTRFTVVAYSDASFAAGVTKQSISGFIVMINGTPLLWGSLKQTVVVDALQNMWRRASVANRFYKRRIWFNF